MCSPTGVSAAVEVVPQGKESIALDMASDDGRLIIYELARRGYIPEVKSVNTTSSTPNSSGEPDPRRAAMRSFTISVCP